MTGDETNFLKVILVMVVISFPGSGMLLNSSTQGFNCFSADVCSHPDRRTNPFGETDDECSSESDGNHFP